MGSPWRRIHGLAEKIRDSDGGNGDIASEGDREVRVARMLYDDARHDIRYQAPGMQYK